MQRLAPSILLLSCLACFACSTANRDGTPKSYWRLTKALELQSEGNFERALEYSERQLLGSRTFATNAHRDLHFDLLRELNMESAASALKNVLARIEAGEDISEKPDSISERECKSLFRDQLGSGGRDLVRSYGPIRSRTSESVARIKQVVTTFDINLDGEPQSIHVLQANDLAAAWLAIDSIATAKISTARLRSVDPALFPVHNCHWRRRQREEPEEVDFPDSGRGAVTPGIDGIRPPRTPLPSIRLPD